MEQFKYSCLQHKNQQILFVCAVNQWHFKPLCQQCTPSHSQNHPKRLKVNLESFKKIYDQTLKQKDIVFAEYQNRLSQIESMISSKCELQYQKQLRIIQSKIIQQITTYFLKLREKSKAFKEKFITQQKLKITQINNVLKSQIQLLQTLGNQNLTIEQWEDIAKKIYFKDKMNAYLQQSKQSMQEYNKNLLQFHPFKIQSHIKISQKLQELLFSSTKFIQQQKQVQKNNKQQVNNAIKKKQVIKIKKKLCKVCNQEMEYLTQLKKHLICRYCGGKQRNYLKQK